MRYLWTNENIYSQSLKWIRIDQITVTLWYNHILEAQTGQINFRCSLVYLLTSNLKYKVRYLWTDKNMYSQSLNWIRIGQITVRLWYNHILEPQTGQVNFRCSLDYLIRSNSKCKLRYLWTDKKQLFQQFEIHKNWSDYCQTMVQSYHRGSDGAS